MPEQVQYEPVDASPVKSFFVSMLTRDIYLEEAILDLLDNCVDGILRSTRRPPKKKPYEQFWADIEFSGDAFSISDNCGGIPWSLREYAFKMGRPPGRPSDAPGTVGVYGIGMKRAMFKMGRHCLISTQSGRHAYEVEIPPEWIRNDKDWWIPVRSATESMKEDGTTILVGKLLPGIAARFSEDAEVFTRDLDDMIGTHYAFIIDKGFRVTINGNPVKPRPTRLVFSQRPVRGQAPRIHPFMFTTKTDDGVEVFLAVGFTRPIPSAEEAAAEQEEPRRASIDAGWTVLCNDRAVLYCNRDELTGWGEAGIPRYHTQFIAISGIVEFRCDDASKLPTTTTKRGIDASSSLYLQIKNKMREGMRVFIDYTNKWKGRAAEAKRHIEAQPTLSFEEVKQQSKGLRFATTTRSLPKGKQYTPKLPQPRKLGPRKVRVSFVKDASDVKVVAGYLFKGKDPTPGEVGERCFDVMLKEARR